MLELTAAAAGLEVAFKFTRANYVRDAAPGIKTGKWE